MVDNQDQKEFDAALELASELQIFDGAKFLRSQLGCSLTEGLQLCKRVARLYPTSPMAASVENYERQVKIP